MAQVLWRKIKQDVREKALGASRRVPGRTLGSSRKSQGRLEFSPPDHGEMVNEIRPDDDGDVDPMLNLALAVTDDKEEPPQAFKERSDIIKLLF